MAEIFDLNVIDASNTARWPEGMARSQINNSARADEGILARWYKDTDGSITSSGSANAYAITSNRTIAALFNNLLIAWTANFTNTGAATLALNGLAAKAIKRPNGDALVAGDIVSGQAVIVIYKSGPDYWQILSPTGVVDQADVIFAARAYAEYTANAGLSASAIPIDDTLPQSGEGTEILSSGAVTLKRADSRVRITAQCFGACISNAGDDARPWTMALFKDSGADALAAVRVGPSAENVVTGSTANANGVIEYEDAPGSVGPFTYKIRVGPGLTTDTLRLNGTTSGRLYGGAAKATLVVEEVYV